MMVKTTIYFPEELMRAVKIKARERGSNQADVIRAVVSDAMKDTTRELPHSFGSVHDSEVTARNFEQWIADNWQAES